MDNKPGEELTLQKNPPPRILTSNVESSPQDETIPGTLVSCDPPADEAGHGTSLLPSELCESVLAHPGRYLEGVPIFGIDEGDEEAQHTHVPATNIDLVERMPILEPTVMGPSSFEARAHHPHLGLGSSGSCEHLESTQGQLKVESLPGGTEDTVEPKDAKVELLNSVPFLVSEEGVLFQCFPISEKELIIMSVNDNALLMNESLTAPIATSESASSGSSSYLKLDNSGGSTSKFESVISGKEDSTLELPAVPEMSTQHCDPSSIILSSSGLNENTGSIPSCGITESSQITQVSLVNHTPTDETSTSDCEDIHSHNDNSNIRRRKLENILESPEKGVKVTHATIYAPVPRKVKSGVGEGEEQGGNEWLHCFLCSDTLPSLATLRHHLVIKHNQKDIKSYQCFLCQQECWIESQQEWHLRVHHGIKNPSLACQVCGAQLATRTECRAHLRKHPATHACPACSKKFSSHHQLAAHVQHHLTQLQPHSCLLCGASFIHPATLTLHARRHTPHSCLLTTCHHTAQDESWLIAHLHHHHAQPHPHLAHITSTEDAHDHRLDTLLVGYTALSHTHTSQQPHTSWQSHTSHQARREAEVKGFRDSPPECKEQTLKHSSALKGDELKSWNCDGDEGDNSTCESIVRNLVEAVAGVEEEGRGVVEEVQLLQKVLQQQPGPYRCGLCNVYLPSAQDLATHKARHNQTIFCVKCEKSFLSVKQLKRHMTVHSSQDTAAGTTQHHTEGGDHQHQCVECGKVCGSESALSRHRGTHTRSRGRHQCQVCLRRVRTRHHLTEHMARVHKINPESKILPCPMCERHFTSKAHLNIHLISHGEGSEAGLWCGECGRKFVRPRSLQRHLATHRRTFTCPTCGQTFLSARTLATHARTHDPTHTTRLSCPECPQRFAYDSQLAIHMRVHTGEKPYQCETCGKPFKRLQQCRAHQRMIHGSQREACVECGKTFGDKTNLLRHRLMVHYHLKRWVCGVCAQSYAYSQDLRNHLGKQHNLNFHRINPGTRKSRHEVYVVPEVGSSGVTEALRAEVERVCEMERNKVQQVLASTCNNLKNPPQICNPIIRDLDDPDDPVGTGEGMTLGTLQPPGPSTGPSSCPTLTGPSSCPTLTLPALAPMPTLPSLDHTRNKMMYKSQEGVAPGEGLVQGVVRVACAQCGTEAGAGLQCAPCGAVVCSQPHLDLHVDANHRVFFQCSLCVLGYGGQGEGTVAALPQPSLLALHGDSSTYLPPQPPLSLHVSGGNQQVGMPVLHSQPLVQVGAGIGVGTRGNVQQMPLVLAQQPAAPASVVLQCPSGSVLPPTLSIIPQVTLQDPPKYQDKQTLITMTDFLSHNPSAITKQERKDSHGSSRDHDGTRSEPVCMVTLPSSTSGQLVLPIDEGPLDSFTAEQGLAGVTSHPDCSDDTSTLVLGSPGSSTQGTTGSMLLVGSLPQPQATPSSPIILTHTKKCIDQPASTSMASVLLTLATPSHQDLPASPPPPASHSPPPLLVASLPEHKNQPAKVTDTEVGGAGDDPGESQPHTASPSQPHQHKHQEAVGYHPGPPQEVSVEIIQPRPRRAKAAPSCHQQAHQAASEGEGAAREGFECPTCGKKFQSTSHLDRHQRTHEVHRHTCHVCSKSFTEKYNLKTHMLIHTRERPHTCSQCHKDFRYLRDLTEHKRTHEGSRPHICAVCSHRFVRRRDYTRHYREQHCNERHQCKVCGASFKRRVYLEMVHMRTHHPSPHQAGEKEDKCEDAGSGHREKSDSKEVHLCRMCGKTFARARYLTSHMHTHSRRADYIRCSKCPRMFTSERTLKVHKEAFHDRDTGHSQDGRSQVDDSRQQETTAAPFFSDLSQLQCENSCVSKPNLIDQIAAKSSSSSSSLLSSSSNFDSSAQTCQLGEAGVPKVEVV